MKARCFGCQGYCFRHIRPMISPLGTQNGVTTLEPKFRVTIGVTKICPKPPGGVGRERDPVR
jgi:hypothetical protein